jgi:DNA-directed RNA polymerase subunit beta'
VKENVIIGKKIPGGTGFKDYKDLDIEIKKSHKVITEIAEQE